MRKKKLKKIIFILIPFILLAVGSTFFLRPKFIVSEFKDNIEVSYKSEYKPDYGSICYGNLITCREVKVKTIGEVDTSTLGSYNVTYKIEYRSNELELSQKIDVVDKEEPVIEVMDNAKVCPNGKIQNIAINAVDNYDGDLKEKIELKYESDKVIVSVSDSNGNTAKKELDAEVIDSEAPKINLNGKESVNVVINGTYKESGATALDNCDEVEVKIEGKVDTSKVGTYNIKYSAADKSGNTSSITRKVNVYKPVPGTKVVYLTFDDGPSVYTSKLLDVLKKYNVKATFFVTKNGSDDLIKREYDEGHSIALHTYSHDYKKIYTSTDAFFEDLYKIQDRVERITGYKSYLMRFAGGSSNTISKNYDGGTHIMSALVKEVQNRGFTYFDWNVSSGDAGGTTSTEKVISNVTKSLKSGSSIVLQHDIKGFSVNAVEEIIKYGLENGYTFERLTETSPTAHHGVLN